MPTDDETDHPPIPFGAPEVVQKAAADVFGAGGGVFDGLAAQDLDEEDPEEELSLFLGNPSAFMGAPEEEGEAASVLLTRDTPESRKANPGTSVQGCIATVGCGCGQPFIMDLLTDNLKSCPGCGKRYTSMLVIAPQDDDQIFGDVLEHVRLVNEGPDAPAGQTSGDVEEPEAD